MAELMNRNRVSRRDFLKTTSAVSAAVMLSGAGKAFAAGSDTLRVGLIGCGGRGSGAFADCVASSQGIELVAIGELFKDRLDKSIKRLREQLVKEEIAEDRIEQCLKVSPEAMFYGFDAFQKVINCDLDMLIIATPPHFRPEHLRAAVEAGKHVFMEKPVAVDPVGVRSVIESAAMADEKKLCIVAGTQRRHQNHYIDIMKRIHNGDIGELVAAQCYWNTEALWVEKAAENMADRRTFGWSDMEWQIRNWLFMTWLSGDHIVEQHVHNLDIVNWAFDAHPVKCMGMGGRQVRTGSEFGNVFDHFAVEYEYPNGARVLSMCRQTKGCSSRVSERIVGTKGWSYTSSSNGKMGGAYEFEAPESPNPYVQEHGDLVRCIREGTPINEAKRVAESTMTAIIGRMSAYAGRELKWDWAMNKSTLDLRPEKYEFGELPLAPVAVPGESPLI